MVDDVILNAGSGGDTVAADDIGGVKYQRVKVTFGADGAASDVTSTATNPLPVALSDIDNAVLDSIDTAVNGTLTVDLGANNDVVTTADATDGGAHGASQTGFRVMGTDGTNDQQIAVDASGNIQADIVNTPTVTANAGTGTFTVDGSAVTQPVSGTVTANAGTGTFAVDIDGSSVVSTDDTTTHTAATTTAVNIAAVATPTDTTVEANDIAMPAMSLDRRLHVDADVAIDGTSIASGNGTATNAMRVSLASDSTGQVQLAAGSASIGTLGANSGVDIGDVDILSIAAGTNLIGDVGVGVRTSGGTTIFRSLDLDETEEEIKATAGQVYWIHAMNLSASALYLKFYNATAATVVVGTTTPVLTFPLATQGDTNGAGFTLSIPNGIAFSTAITVACTTGIADNDTGAPGANTCVVNIGYA